MAQKGKGQESRHLPGRPCGCLQRSRSPGAWARRYPQAWSLQSAAVLEGRISELGERTPRGTQDVTPTSSSPSASAHPQQLFHGFSSCDANGVSRSALMSRAEH